MINRLTIVLEQPEYSGLLEISTKELRQPQDQARYIIQRELVKRGLLKDTAVSTRSHEEGDNAKTPKRS